MLGEFEAVVHVLLQFHARQGIALVNLLTDAREMGAAIHQLGGGVVGGGLRGGVLETAGIGADSGKEAIGDGRGDRPLGLLEKAIDEFAAAGGFGVDPVDVAVACVGAVMIDVDERAAFAD